MSNKYKEALERIKEREEICFENQEQYKSCRYCKFDQEDCNVLNIATQALQEPEQKTFTLEELENKIKKVEEFYGEQIVTVFINDLLAEFEREK
jgi:hypothetical protein